MCYYAGGAIRDDEEGDVGANGEMSVEDDKDCNDKMKLTNKIEAGLLRTTACQITQYILIYNKTQRTVAGVKKNKSGSILMEMTDVLGSRKLG